MANGNPRKSEIQIISIVNPLEFILNRSTKDIYIFKIWSVRNWIFRALVCKISSNMGHAYNLYFSWVSWRHFSHSKKRIQQLWTYYNQRSDTQQNFIYFEIIRIDFTVSLLSFDTLITKNRDIRGS